IEHQPRKPTDDHAVETYILQVPADIGFYQPGELAEVPALDLIGDEFRHAAFLALDERRQRHHETLVHVGPDAFVAGQMLSNLDEHTREMDLDHGVRRAGILLDELADALPHVPRKIANLGAGQKIPFQSVGPP